MLPSGEAEDRVKNGGVGEDVIVRRESGDDEDASSRIASCRSGDFRMILREREVRDKGMSSMWVGV